MFTAVAGSVLHFVHVVVRGDSLEARAIAPDGDVIDRFSLRGDDPQRCAERAVHIGNGDTAGTGAGP